MNNLTCLAPELFECIAKSGTLLITIATGIVIVGYWFKPRFNIQIDNINSTSTHIRVTVFNYNFLGNTIKDINCELTLAKDKNFSDEVKTLDLIKPWILCLKRKPANYVFIAVINSDSQPNNSIKGKNYLRVRLLAPNFLGVKKVSEKILKI